MKHNQRNLWFSCCQEKLMLDSMWAVLTAMGFPWSIGMSHDLHVFFSLSLGSSQSSLSCTIDVRSIWCGKPKATHFCKGLVWLIIWVYQSLSWQRVVLTHIFSANLCSIQFHPRHFHIQRNFIQVYIQIQAIRSICLLFLGTMEGTTSKERT